MLEESRKKPYQIWSYYEGEIPVRKLKFGLKRKHMNLIHLSIDINRQKYYNASYLFCSNLNSYRTDLLFFIV
jgi:hypothetical protein